MKYYTTVALALSILVNIFSLGQNIMHRNLPVEGTEEVKARKPDTLSRWDIFTLALMKVESEFDNDAVSSVGARGYFQMTPVYVEEVNRIHNTDYKFSDVLDFGKAHEIFILMQEAHNPGYNMKKALELHNGKHEWYNRRVFKAMKEFERYEEMRNMLKTYEEI